MPCSQSFSRHEQELAADACLANQSCIFLGLQSFFMFQGQRSELTISGKNDCHNIPGIDSVNHVQSHHTGLWVSTPYSQSYTT